MCTGLKEAKKTNAKWIAAGQEIGVYPPTKAFMALRNEAIWHHQNTWVEDFSRNVPTDKRNTAYYMNHRTKAVLVDALCPNDAKWEKEALRLGVNVFEECMKYLEANNFN